MRWASLPVGKATPYMRNEAWSLKCFQTDVVGKLVFVTKLTSAGVTASALLQSLSCFNSLRTSLLVGNREDEGGAFHCSKTGGGYATRPEVLGCFMYKSHSLL